MTDPIYDPATLVALREAAGFTSTEVATITGIPVADIDEYECGELPARIDTLRRLCLLYRVSLACAFLPADDVRKRFTGRRWTNVDEALPEVGEQVLVWSKHLGVHLAVKATGAPNLGPGFQFETKFAPVTHWMRLPDPPSEQGS